MSILSPRIKVAVLRGGPSHAYDDSMKTGAYVLSLLREFPETYEPLDIFISRDGEWHSGGLSYNPHESLRHTDVVWNALHGPYGEDGQVQSLLESLQVPFTGSGTVPAAMALNKGLAKELYRRHSLLTPAWSLVSEDSFSDDQLIEIFRTHLHPVIVKPANGARGLGVKLVHTFQELKDAVLATFGHSKKVLVEDLIKGLEVTCVVIEKAKGQELYAPVPVGRATPAQNQEIEAMAKKAHEILGLRHYSGSDFIITPRGKIYLLETNSLPTFHEESLMHESLAKTGWKHRDFADHCVKLALGQVF